MFDLSFGNLHEDFDGTLYKDRHAFRLSKDHLMRPNQKISFYSHHIFFYAFGPQKQSKDTYLS